MLQPGQTKRVKFTLSSRDIAYFDDNGDAVIQPGLFKVWVGGNSVSGLQAEFTLANGAGNAKTQTEDGKHNTGYVGGVEK